MALQYLPSRAFGAAGDNNYILQNMSLLFQYNLQFMILEHTYMQIYNHLFRNKSPPPNNYV